MPAEAEVPQDLLEPLVGKTLVDGRYQVLSLLGRGGQCAVFRVLDRTRRKHVAMKVLAQDVAAAWDLRARFDREAAAGHQIDHPNVAATFEKGKLDDGSRFFTMELLDGRSLGDEVARGRVPLRRAIALTTQVLAGLEAAHKLGIAHRDVKPDNIMLVKRSGREIVKIVDFGIASDDHAAVKLTAAGLSFGTPEYISPEMAMGLPADARADIYAVGVMLFEMLTGRRPYSAPSPRALLAAHVNEAIPSPTKIAPDAKIPAAVESVIVRAMAKLSQDRYQSADAMRVALAAAVPRRIAPWIALALLLTAVAVAGAWWKLARSTDEASMAEPAEAPVQKDVGKQKHRKVRSHAR